MRYAARTRLRSETVISGRDFAMFGNHQPHPGVLDVIHILVLFGVHAVEATGPSPATVEVDLHSAIRPEQKIAEVNSVRVPWHSLILIVNLDASSRPLRVDRCVGAPRVSNHWLCAPAPPPM